MSDQTIDALVYSSIKNTISSDDWQNYIKVPTPGWSDVDGSPATPSILSDTTIKRACCNPLLNRTVPVRIPLTPDIITDNNIPANDIRIKYNYFDKDVTVPKNLCDKYPDYQWQSDKGGNAACDDFYRGYCANILYEYKKMTGADIDPTKYNVMELLSLNQNVHVSHNLQMY